MTLVGDDIMLCTAVQHRDSHLRITQQHTLFLEAIVAQPYQVVQRFIDGIDTFFTGGMTALAVGYTINNHQPLLGNGWLHASGLTDDGHVNLGQLGQGQ